MYEQNYFDINVVSYSKCLADDFAVDIEGEWYGVSLFIKCEYDKSDHRLRNIEISVMNIMNDVGETGLTVEEIDDYGTIAKLISDLESDEQELMSILNIT